MMTPILFAVSFVLTLFAKNMTELKLTVLPVPVFTVLLFAILYTWFSRRLLSDQTKGNVFSSVSMVLFFSYREALIQIRNVFTESGGVALGSDKVLFFIWIALLLFLFAFIRIARRTFQKTEAFLRITVMIMVVWSGITIGWYELHERLQKRIYSPMVLPLLNKQAAGGPLPDIYYIVPDSYSASSVLQEYFHLDNTEFTAFLLDNDFYIATESVSNYPKTFLSLASTFNMEYLDYLSGFESSSDQTVITPLIENSNVFRLLKSLGYRYYQMGSWWGPTHYNKYADGNFILENKYPLDIDPFFYMMIDSTLFHPFMENYFPSIAVGESYEDKRDRVIYQFDTIGKLAQMEGPKFVFAHILSPHGPYVFESDCRFKDFVQEQPQPVEAEYVDQVQCVNKKLQTVITAILKKAPGSIILLQSDEGAGFLGGRLTPADNWKESPDELLQLKFPILSAYYLPGVSHETLYSSITPVNSFRVIFNLYFDTNLPLLPDQNYIFPDMSNLYQFVDVTQRIQESDAELH